MVEVEDLTSLLKIDEQGDFGASLAALGAKLGFERTLFGMTASRQASLNRPFVEGNYPAAWRSYYDAQSLAYIDPTVKHCMSSNTPLVWHPDMFAGTEPQALYEEARGYGLRSGVTLPVHGPQGEFGVFSVASDLPSDSRFARHAESMQAQLSILRDFVFTAASRLAAASATTRTPHLTLRELEVLKWTAAGKASWDISMILGCSEATVNFHMANIRAKFGVRSRRVAVIQAIRLGLISPSRGLA